MRFHMETDELQAQPNIEDVFSPLFFRQTRSDTFVSYEVCIVWHQSHAIIAKPEIVPGKPKRNNCSTPKLAERWTKQNLDTEPSHIRRTNDTWIANTAEKIRI